MQHWMLTAMMTSAPSSRARMRPALVSCLLLLSAAAPRSLAAQQAESDPFIWLEDIDGRKSMDWVNAHNASTVAALGTTPLYQSIYARTKQILDSKNRIPYPSIVGDMLYNF